mmetsp:Transcript_2428/g.6573  ORF Transcript_2428/g.6573 Transcript_2428/m.6573 type:complete len:416 (-) Transcript_2428:305-1552(-)
MKNVPEGSANNHVGQVPPSLPNLSPAIRALFEHFLGHLYCGLKLIFHARQVPGIVRDVGSADGAAILRLGLNGLVDVRLSHLLCLLPSLLSFAHGLLGNDRALARHAPEGLAALLDLRALLEVLQPLQGPDPRLHARHQTVPPSVEVAGALRDLVELSGVGCVAVDEGLVVGVEPLEQPIAFPPRLLLELLDVRVRVLPLGVHDEDDVPPLGVEGVDHALLVLDPLLEHRLRRGGLGSPVLAPLGVFGRLRPADGPGIDPAGAHAHAALGLRLRLHLRIALFQRRDVLAELDHALHVELAAVPRRDGPAQEPRAGLLWVHAVALPELPAVFVGDETRVVRRHLPDRQVLEDLEDLDNVEGLRVVSVVLDDKCAQRGIHHLVRRKVSEQDKQFASIDSSAHISISFFKKMLHLVFI